ncbi:MAG: hypothetical protein JO121_09585 [Deltaproteobacteria bacterium]|nr:hypothetical protein [Deltaproteobacteria bacterium]
MKRWLFDYLRGTRRDWSASFAGWRTRQHGESYDCGYLRLLAVSSYRRCWRRHGDFLTEALKAHAGPLGVLFDQPQVVNTPEYLQRAGVLDRCEVAGGSFFESVPPGVDLSILKRVMHDWSDDVCAGSLSRCHDAVAKDERIVVIDAVVPPGNAPHLRKTVDLLMM